MSDSVYDKLVSLLALDSLQDIEVAHYPLLQRENNEHAPFFLHEDRHLAVPLKSLLSVYPLACRRLISSSPEQVWDATSVLLLQTPDHLTALNARRRQLLRSGSSHIARELRYIDVLLTVPSNSKVAALWHHRRWLRAWQLTGSPSRGRALQPDLLKGVAAPHLDHEVAQAARACESYRRNHSAWAHRAFLAKVSSAEQTGRELEHVSSWVDRHIADHSAAQYLFTLARRLQSTKAREQSSELVQRYPARETPWALLRMAMTLDEGRALIISHLTIESSAAQTHALKAAIWYLSRTERLTLDVNVANQVAGQQQAGAELVHRIQRLLVAGDV